MMMVPYMFNEALMDDLFSNDWEHDFDRAMKAAAPRGMFGKRAANVMKTDVRENKDSYDVFVDLPGFKKEDIQLQLDGDTLTIQAQRHSEHEEQEKKGKYVCCERSYGAYSRSFDVSGIRAEGITASYDSGVLTLKLPKKTVEVSSSRQISID